jgi:hypothetical protein
MDQKTERLRLCEVIRTSLSSLQHRDAMFDGVNNIVDRAKSDDVAVIFGSQRQIDKMPQGVSGELSVESASLGIVAQRATIGGRSPNFISPVRD